MVKQIPPSSISHGEVTHKFETLDGLRGIAALTVVLAHVGYAGRVNFEHAYLSVDLFFILSGFVLSYAYQKKLDAGVSTLSFAKIRIIRLYPLYLLSLPLAWAFWWTLARIKHGPLEPHPFLLALMSLFLIPVVGRISTNGPFAFPYNSPSWSLYIEIVVNIFHALCLRRVKTATLSVLVVVAGLILSVTSFSAGGLNLGFGRGLGLLYGFARVFFAYPAGMLLFRFWSANRGRWKCSPLTPCALLLLALFAKVSAGIPNAAFDLSMAFMGFPLILTLAAFSEPTGRWKPVFTKLGSTSYGVYVLHMPVALYFLAFLKDVVHIRPDKLEPWTGFLFLAFIVAFADAADRFFDIPMRRWLRRVLG